MSPEHILRHYFGISLIPAWNNVLATLLAVFYVQIVLLLGDLIKKAGASSDVSRKFVHIGAASWIICWPWFDDTHWTWKLNIFVPFVQGLKLSYKGAFADPTDVDVQIMCRHGNPKELFYGPLQFCIFMCYLGLFKFMTLDGCIIMAATGIGDGIAPLVGKFYGSHKYRLPFGGQKSLEGSFFGVFMGTLIGSLIFPLVIGLPTLSIYVTIQCAVFATVFEAGSPEGFDNIFVPLMMNLVVKHNPMFSHV